MARFCTECGDVATNPAQKFCVSCGGELPATPAPNEAEKRSKPRAAKETLRSELKRIRDEMPWAAEFPALRGMYGEMTFTSHLLALVSAPILALGAWLFWFEGWGLVFAIAAILFIVWFFYGMWKFHTYQAIALQTDVLIQLLRDSPKPPNPDADNTK